MDTGWLNITNEQHHKLGAISSSGIKLFAQSPRKYYHKYVARDWGHEPYSQAFLIGTCVHMWLLEPEEAAKKIVTCSEKCTTKAYKEAILSHWPDIVWNHEANGGGRFFTKEGDVRYVMTASIQKTVSAMVSSANSHEMFCKLKALSVAEISGVAKYGEHLLSCRGDLKGKLPSGQGFFLDVKTCDTINEYTLQNSLFHFGYHIQQLHYLHVANLIEPNTYKYFYFFYIEKQFPHECGLITLDMTADEQFTLDNLYKKILGELIACHKTNVWPTFDKSKCAQVRVPYWVLNKLI